MKPLCYVWLSIYGLSVLLLAVTNHSKLIVDAYFVYTVVTISVPRILGPKKWADINRRLVGQ